MKWPCIRTEPSAIMTDSKYLNANSSIYWWSNLILIYHMATPNISFVCRWQQDVKLPGSAGLIPRIYKQHNHSLRLITSKVAVSISFIYLLWGGVVHRSPHKQIYVFTEDSAMVRLRDILCRFGSKEVCFGVIKPPKWIQSVLEDAKLQIWFASYPDLLSQVGIHLL